MSRNAAVLAAACALLAVPPAVAQVPYARPGNDIGTGQSLPLSNNASNITAGDTRSPIAPRLPSPAVSESAPPAAFLTAARTALAAGRTGEAQEALERAESRALDRSVKPSLAGQANASPLVSTIAQARDALSRGDRQATIRLIDTALRDPQANIPAS